MLMCEQAGYNWKGSNYIYIFDEWLCDIVQPLNRVQLFVTPWTAAHQVSFFTVSWNLLRFVFIELMTLSNHLILCRPLLLVPSIFPSTAVFSNELALRIRWWKHWSFSISPSSEYSGLIPFKIDLISLLSKGLWRVFSSTTIQKHPFFGRMVYNTAMLLGYLTVPLTLHRQTETPH